MIKGLSLLLVISLWLAFGDMPDDILNDMRENRADQMHRFFLALAGLSGTLMGFVISSMSLLIGLSSNRVINNLKKTGHYPVLMRNFFGTGVSFFLSMIFSVISSFLNNLYLWKFDFMLFSASIILLVITGDRFRKVMSVVNQPEGDPEGLD